MTHKNEAKWENNELLLLITVCAQVGINQATDLSATVCLDKRILIGS